MQATWDYNHTLPDLRLLIIQPTVLRHSSLSQLSSMGWGLCHVPRLDFLKVQYPKYADAFGKLFVWNMTQYEVVVWMDSDTLAVKSLHSLFSKADQLMSPTSVLPGPRIGAAFDGEYYKYLVFNKTVPPKGSVFDDINSGVFIIKPGK